MDRGQCEQSSRKPHPDASGTAPRKRRGCHDRTAAARQMAVPETGISSPSIYAYGAREPRVTGFSHDCYGQLFPVPGKSRINSWSWILILLTGVCRFLPPARPSRLRRVPARPDRRDHGSHRMDLYACSPHRSHSRSHVHISVGVVASETINPSQRSRTLSRFPGCSIPRGYNPGHA